MPGPFAFRSPDNADRTQLVPRATPALQRGHPTVRSCINVTVRPKFAVGDLYRKLGIPDLNKRALLCLFRLLHSSIAARAMWPKPYRD
jgi:hypothetical protein